MKQTLIGAKFDQVESSVLSAIEPKESILPIVNEFVSLLEKSAKKLKFDCRIVIGGSVAKNTYLSGDFDCDVFVRFSPKKYSDDEIATRLSELVETSNLFDAQLLHGSRDYYKVVVGGITYELVPTLDVAVANDAPNITDMSLFHVEWVVQKCKQISGMNNQIRLTKAFCKSQRVYGAESYIGGFSGHVVDILVIACGGFRQLLDQCQTWGDKFVLDVENYYPNGDALTRLNEAKLTSPIIVIDPIVAQRNAASALSAKCFEKFKASAKKYLENPSVDFFKATTFDSKSLEKVSGVTYEISVVPLSDKKDIAGAQHVKVLEYVLEQAKLHEFNVVGSGWTWNSDMSGNLFVRVANDELSSTTTVRGPPVDLAHAVKAFKSIHRKIVEKDGKLWATVQRKFSRLGSLLDSLQKHELVTIRCKSFSWKVLK